MRSVYVPLLCLGVGLLVGFVAGRGHRPVDRKPLWDYTQPISVLISTDDTSQVHRLEPEAVYLDGVKRQVTDPSAADDRRWTLMIDGNRVAIVAVER